MSESCPEHIIKDTAWFKDRSLARLKENLAQHHYAGYPEERLTYQTPRGVLHISGRWHLPHGGWDSTRPPQIPDMKEVGQLAAQGYQFDTLGRPLHPWLEDLLQPGVGVVTGRGAYWRWGPNYTADPLLIRTDLPVPHVLIIKRQDTGLWALPGGFVDAGENAFEAALREAHEETNIDWRHMVTDSWTVYTGPMADIRTTAHAWPETSAYGLLLDPQQTAGLPTGPFGGNINEVQAVRWLPIHEHESVGFGSHQLLIELAIDHL